MEVVRLVSAIFINARFTAPWCYQSPSADAAAPILEPGAERVVIFHLITEGECYVELQVMCTDLDAYSRWAREVLFKLPNFKDLHTSFSLGEVKAGAALPLGHLAGR